MLVVMIYRGKNVIRLVYEPLYIQLDNKIIHHNEIIKGIKGGKPIGSQVPCV